MSARLLTHNIDKHSHPPCQMPHDMTVKEPDTRVVSPEPENGVSASRDLHCIAEDGAGEVVGIGILIIVIVIAGEFEARRTIFEKRIV